MLKYLKIKKGSLQQEAKVFTDLQKRVDIFDENDIVDVNKLDKFNDIMTDQGSIKSNTELVDLGYDEFHFINNYNGDTVDPETGLVTMTHNDKKAIVYNNMLEPLRQITSQNLGIDEKLAVEGNKQNSKIKTNIEKIIKNSTGVVF